MLDNSQIWFRMSTITDLISIQCVVERSYTAKLTSFVHSDQNATKNTLFISLNYILQLICSRFHACSSGSGEQRDNSLLFK